MIFDCIVDGNFAVNDNFKEDEYQKFMRRSHISEVLSREEMLWCS